MLLAHRFLWMIPLIFLSKTQLCLTNHAPTKRASTALLPCQLSLVCSLPISTSTVVRFTIGALAVTPRTHPSATVSASGSLPDAAPLLSTWTSQVTSSSATASFPLMLPSAMALTSSWSDGLATTTEVSGAWLVSPHSGHASRTGCSPSTSERVVNLQTTNTIGRSREKNY